MFANSSLQSNWANETVRAARRSKFMCALVLALRKIPIYAPGGGGAPLGSSDMPTYSVSVSDAEAAAKREAFAKTKEAKRMVPSPAVVHRERDTNGDSTSADIPSGSSTSVRNRSATTTTNPPSATEKATLDTLHTRPPSTDAARDNEPLTRPITAHSHLSPASSPSSSSSADLDALRTSLLHRQATLGKRRSARPSHLNIPTIAERTTPPPHLNNMNFHDPATSTHSPVETAQRAMPMHQPLAPGKAGQSGYLSQYGDLRSQNAVQALQGGPGSQMPLGPPLDVGRV